jgi:phage gpG-like protein
VNADFAASAARLKQQLWAHCRENLQQAGLMLTQQAKDNVSGGGVSGLQVWSGQLRDSISMEPYESGNIQGVRVGCNLRGDECQYARIHELGGVTHPTVTMAMRKWARRTYEAGGKENTATIYLDAEVYLAISKTKRAKLTVPIPARPFLRPTLDQRAIDLRVILSRPMRE